MSTCLRIAPEPLERSVVRHIESRNDKDGMSGHRVRDARGVRSTRGADELPYMDQTHLATSVERTAVEGIEQRVVRVRIGVPRGRGERGMLLHEPFGRQRHHHRDIGLWRQTSDQATRRLDLGPERSNLAVRPAGFAAVGQDATPIRFRAETQRVPMPVLDHPGSTDDERPGDLPPLAVKCRPVVPWLSDVRRVGLGHQVGRLTRREHAIGGLEQCRRAIELPAVRARAIVRESQCVLHHVVRVAADDIEAACQGLRRRPLAARIAGRS